MATIYEIWDAPSRNLIATYRSEDDALAAVRQFVVDDGIESLEGVVLMRQEPDGSGDVVAADAALAHLAEARQPSSSPA